MICWHLQYITCSDEQLDRADTFPTVKPAANKLKLKSFPSHKGPQGGADLLSIVLSQTPAEATIPQTQGYMSRGVPV